MSTVEFPRHVSMEQALMALWEHSSTPSRHTYTRALPTKRVRMSSVKTALRAYPGCLSGEYMYVHSLEGRIIQTHFRSFPRVNSYGYDRANGEGAMAKVVEFLNQK